MKTNHALSDGRPHYELKELKTWSEDRLIEYIIFTMQRKGMTEYDTSLFPGYFGKKIDRPQDWHLLFWPFLGGYRHTYEWTRVYLKDGKLMCEFKEEISKYQYDFEDIPILNKIFPAPAGETYGERYCPTILRTTMRMSSLICFLICLSGIFNPSSGASSVIWQM